MARDASYQPGVYRSQGGNVLTISTTDGNLNVETGATLTVKSGGTIDIEGTIKSTGTLTVESGAAMTINSGGTLTNAGTLANTGALANTGTITNSSDGQIREVVETLGPAGAIKPYGISVIGTTAGATAMTMVKPPAAGVRKTLICKQSTGGLLVRCSSLCTLNYSANRKITFAANADGYALELVATTSTNWQSIRNSTAQVTTIVYGTS
jgi:hypothetical protein